MKKYIHFLTIAIVSLVFTSCTESDDEFFASKNITSNELIEVNTTGNQLNISCYYSRVLPQTGANPFDLFATSTSRKFFFNYTLEKRNTSGTWDYFTPETINTVEGENIIGDYISAITLLDALDTNYEYESNITLSAGQYRVKVEPKIVSLNSQNAVMVSILTSTLGISSNVLEFTVN